VSGVSSLNIFFSSNRCSDCMRLTATERHELFILTVETSYFNPVKEVCSPLSKDTMVSMSDGSPSSSFLAMESPALVAKGWRGRGWWLGGGGRCWWLMGSGWCWLPVSGGWLNKLGGVRKKIVGGGGLKALNINC
jgi:hypothetical protein